MGQRILNGSLLTKWLITTCNTIFTLISKSTLPTIDNSLTC